MTDLTGMIALLVDVWFIGFQVSNSGTCAGAIRPIRLFQNT